VAFAAAALGLPVKANALPDPTKPPEPVSTVAGTGNGAFGGDGGPAAQADLNRPRSVGPAPGGGLLIADTGNNRIRRIDPGELIGTVAGTGSGGFNGDSLLPTLADLDAPSGIAGTSDGGLLIADTRNHRIRKVLFGGALIITVAGNGTQGYSGDGLAASLAQVNSPSSLAPTADGGFLVADSGNNRIRKVSPTGLISTVAGDGSATYGGDGGPASLAQLNGPKDVKMLPDGGFLIADTSNHSIRRVAPDGTMSTVAGNGTNGFSGDDGPPTLAQLNAPEGVAVVDGDFFFIADTKNHRIRKVKNGTIKTSAGDGTNSYGGDGGPAEGAKLNNPVGVYRFPGSESLAVADMDNHRIRAMGILDLAEIVIPGTPAQAEPAGLEPQSASEGSSLPKAVAPKAGRHIKVTRGRGKVKVKLPGALEFVELDQSASVPVGSVVSATGGTVGVTSASNLSGGTQSARFSGGAFRLVQRRARRPVTDLVMVGGSVRTCAAAPAHRSIAVAAGTRRRIRSLWGSGHGRFRTRGRHGAATVRGTKWLTVDRCDGTHVSVRRGLVAVRDFAQRKTIMVPAGRSYLARRAGRIARGLR